MSTINDLQLAPVGSYEQYYIDWMLTTIRKNTQGRFVCPEHDCDWDVGAVRYTHRNIYEVQQHYQRDHLLETPILICAREDCDIYRSTTNSLNSHKSRDHSASNFCSCPVPGCAHSGKRNVVFNHLRNFHGLAAMAKRKGETLSQFYTRCKTVLDDHAAANNLAMTNANHDFFNYRANRPVSNLFQPQGGQGQVGGNAVPKKGNLDTPATTIDFQQLDEGTLDAFEISWFHEVYKKNMFPNEQPPLGEPSQVMGTNARPSMPRTAVLDSLFNRLKRNKPPVVVLSDLCQLFPETLLHKRAFVEQFVPDSLVDEDIADSAAYRSLVFATILNVIKQQPGCTLKTIGQELARISRLCEGFRDKHEEQNYVKYRGPGDALYDVLYGFYVKGLIETDHAEFFSIEIAHIIYYLGDPEESKEVVRCLYGPHRWQPKTSRPELHGREFERFFAAVLMRSLKKWLITAGELGSRKAWQRKPFFKVLRKSLDEEFKQKFEPLRVQQGRPWLV